MTLCIPMKMMPRTPISLTHRRAGPAMRRTKRRPPKGLKAGTDHWEAVRALQGYFARHADTGINARELHDALDERFHAKGGIKYLYTLFPRGPVAQGCRVAGLEPPPGSENTSFGSVM